MTTNNIVEMIRSFAQRTDVESVAETPLASRQFVDEAVVSHISQAHRTSCWRLRWATHQMEGPQT